VTPRHISGIVPATIAMIITTAPCSADPIDSHTSCSIAVRAFDSEKRAGQVLAGAPSPEVLEVGNYILNVMEGLDRKRIEAGEPGIWSNFSDAGKHAIAASAVANCRLHPSSTINQAADVVYRYVRDVHLQLGIIK
jgi:hypothetical protein